MYTTLDAGETPKPIILPSEPPVASLEPYSLSGCWGMPAPTLQGALNGHSGALALLQEANLESGQPPPRSLGISSPDPIHTQPHFQITRIPPELLP